MGSIQSQQQVLFREVRAAWDEADELRSSPETPLGSEESDAMCARVSKRLTSFGVPFCINPSLARSATCEGCRTVSLCGFERDTVAVARFGACAAHLFGYKHPFTLVLALALEPKVLAFDRPLTRREVNSGVTIFDEREILVFRDDGDFFKTLLHECIHLMCLAKDEALTEFGAILIHCMTKTQTFSEYEALLKEQQKRSSVLSDAVRQADVGETNETAYAVKAGAMLREPELVLATGHTLPRLPVRPKRDRRGAPAVPFTVVSHED